MADQIKIKNIYYMLSYAYQNLNEGPYKNIDLESFNNIHDLLSVCGKINVHTIAAQKYIAPQAA